MRYYFSLVLNISTSVSEIRKLREFSNDHHDGCSIHATFFERMCHVKDVLPFHTHAKKTNWVDLAAEFVGSWYTVENLKKVGTIIHAFDSKPKVNFLLY